MYLRIIYKDNKTYYLLVVKQNNYKISKFINEDIYKALKETLKTYEYRKETN